MLELTHLATLYHDDVMDEALVRRGAPSANARWGNSLAILVGDYLFARAAELAAGLGPDAVRIQAQTFARLVQGQIAETVGPRDADPVAAPPSRARRQDRLADRHMRPFRRHVLWRFRPTTTEAVAYFGETLGWPSSFPMICWTSPAIRPILVRPPAPICGKVSPPSRCSTHCPVRTVIRPRPGCGRSSPTAR